VRVDAGAFHGNTLIKEYRFVVETRTRENKPKQVGGESANFAVAVEGPGAPKAKLDDLGNGEYLVSFALPSKGQYKASCRCCDDDEFCLL
jgi:hypothetical protein